MAITALLELRVKPETLDQGLHAGLSAILNDTRAFDGCLGVDVLIDTEDPTHIIAVERWESEEHDAYPFRGSERARRGDRGSGSGRED